MKEKSMYEYMIAGGNLCERDIILWHHIYRSVGVFKKNKIDKTIISYHGHTRLYEKIKIMGGLSYL